MCECHLQYEIHASATEGSGKKATNTKKKHSEDFPTLDELLTYRNRHQRRALIPPSMLCIFALVVVVLGLCQ